MSGYTNVDGICKIFGIVIDHLLQRTDATGRATTRATSSKTGNGTVALNPRDLDGRPTACGRAGRLWTQMTYYTLV